MSDSRLTQALIFDFDGLILDTEVPAFQAWREVYEEHGAVLTLEIWAKVLGGSGREVDHLANLEAAASRRLDGEAIQQRWLARKLALIEAQEILPGVLECIQEGRAGGLKLAVVSSSPHAWVNGYLARLGIGELFDAVVCGEDAPRPKPYPDLYLAALEALDVEPSRTIAFEDSPNGIFCVAIPNDISRQLSTAHADLQLDSLAEMPLSMLLNRVSALSHEA